MRLAVLVGATAGYVGIMIAASTGLATVVAGGAVVWSLGYRAMLRVFP